MIGQARENTRGDFAAGPKIITMKIEKRAIYDLFIDVEASNKSAVLFHRGNAMILLNFTYIDKKTIKIYHRLYFFFLV